MKIISDETGSEKVLFFLTDFKLIFFFTLQLILTQYFYVKRKD